MNSTLPRPRRLSDIIEAIDASQPITVGTLADAFGERAFGALMFIFAVPNVIPTPPGTSAILGLPLVILTFQLMIGRQALWLPESIRRRAISTQVFDGFKRRAVPYIMRFEKVLRPRLSVFVQSNLAERLIGLVTFALAVILFLPIPLVNILPAAAISVLSLGLAERDGVAVVIGYALSAATALLLGLVSTALYEAARAFLHAMFGV